MQRIVCLLIPFILLSGCTFEGNFEVLDGNPVPEFSAYDQDGKEHNLEQKIGEPWILYVSTSWCTHCETTLDAYENVIPEGSLYAFNKDAREQYSNMTEWKEKSEENIGRELNVDFIHAPELSRGTWCNWYPKGFLCRFQRHYPE